MSLFAAAADFTHAIDYVYAPALLSILFALMLMLPPVIMRVDIDIKTPLAAPMFAAAALRHM